MTSLKNTQSEDGFFKPGSIFRRINREGVVLLGGGYAILLQLAHPFVADGVDKYSNFQSEILSRLYRTLMFMHNLAFADHNRSREALRQFHSMHKRIKGRLAYEAGRFPAGTSYTGTDPETKLWVHATFVDTALKVYEQFIKPLSTEERQSYYADSLVLARLLEIPQQILPQTLEEFQQYMDNMLSGDRLAITPTTQRLAQAVLYPKVGFFPAFSAGLLRFVTTGLLTDRFRREYGMTWGKKEQFLLHGLSRSIRLLRPVVPGWIWQSPVQGGKLTYFLLWGRKKFREKK